MSDYLWDKSGEPEEDVERLEQLLGTLRYEPRPFVVPEDFSARPARSTFRAQRTFSWQRLALAASLLLTLLAGAWLLKLQHDKQVRRESARQQQQQPAAPTKEQAPRNETANAGGVSEQPAPRPRETPGVVRVNYRPVKRVFNRARANETRRARQELIKGQPQQLASDQPAMTPEQKAATEQLLLALRIASAKFNYAQREMQEASAAHKPETR